MPVELLRAHNLQKGDRLEVTSDASSIRLSHVNPFAALDALGHAEEDGRTSVEIAEDLRRSLGEEREIEAL